jgi:hypothetical protein
MKQTVINILKHRFLLSACLDRTTESWHFHFTEKCVMTHYGYWRLFEEDVICSSSLDHGHSFGLGREFDAVKAVNAMANQKIDNCVISSDALDITLYFENGFYLQLLSTSAGYESWVIDADKRTYVANGYTLTETTSAN